MKDLYSPTSNSNSNTSDTLKEEIIPIKMTTKHMLPNIDQSNKALMRIKNELNSKKMRRHQDD